MMKNKGPSLREIAERSGVHQSTVSRVLKNDPRISPETVKKVNKAAKDLGYVPDPHLGKLMSHMRGMREKRFETVVGFLLPVEPYPDAFSKDLLRGATGRAQDLGYVVNRFPVEMTPESLRTLNRVLKARNIEGLLLLPRVKNSPPPALEMDQITVVSVTSFTEPFPVHEVLPDHAHNMELIRQHLEMRGAQKPGLISWPDLDRRQHHAGPRMLYQYCLETLNRKPCPVMVWQGNDAEIEKRFTSWIAKQKPDALIIPNPTIEKAVRKLMREMGEAQPPRYASACCAEGFPGIDQQPGEIGRAAIDMLTAHMQRNEKGWPKVTKHMMIPGRWIETADTQSYAKA
ncbi:MAG: LacI family DNA-binding transcriptional regulator [Verrucomicrobia bacterium]|nr:LacI family DNA-binding transcriptional regulator [Verrucomicrobiota bacterium]MCH8511002.1 LacI family transcriptional regulator [Kiritimatiellia bacterium]